MHHARARIAESIFHYLVLRYDIETMHASGRPYMALNALTACWAGGSTTTV